MIQWRPHEEVEADANLVVEATILGAEAPRKSFSTWEFDYRIRVESVHRGRTQAKTLEVTYDDDKAHRRGEMIVCPIKHGTGIENELEVGKRYELFLESSDENSELLLARALTQVTIDSGEAEAVLAILEARRASAPITDEHWRRLLESDGYRRLKQREASMNRAFEDDDFRAFVLSPELQERRKALAKTLAGWSKIDATAAVERASRYLPAGTVIEATIYPVIKPKTNSFVFDLASDPAIFFYLDPQQSAGVFENTLAHELHHVGYAKACGVTAAPQGVDAQAAAVRRWIGAFGEGLAMLAAAGSPDVHPHAASPAADRERWDRDVARFDRDLQRVERFFLDILDGKLASNEEQLEVARGFYGVQGPWYTVGWKMAVTIEQNFGRERLISILCDPVKLLASYNEAAGDGPQARWSSTLIDRLRR